MIGNKINIASSDSSFLKVKVVEVLSDGIYDTVDDQGKRRIVLDSDIVKEDEVFALSAKELISEKNKQVSDKDVAIIEDYKILGKYKSIKARVFSELKEGDTLRVCRLYDYKGVDRKYLVVLAIGYEDVALIDKDKFTRYLNHFKYIKLGDIPVQFSNR